MALKEKYDREGVEFIDDEMEMKDKTGGEESANQQKEERAKTRSGARKPGKTSSGPERLYSPSSISALNGGD